MGACEQHSAFSTPGVTDCHKEIILQSMSTSARDNLCMTRGMRYKVRRKLANNQIVHNAMQGA